MAKLGERLVEAGIRLDPEQLVLLAITALAF